MTCQKQDAFSHGSFGGSVQWWFCGLGRLQKISMAVVVVDAAEDWDSLESLLECGNSHRPLFSRGCWKKPLWRPFWNILGSARYTPKIYRYTVANLSFGASKKNPSIGTSWPWVLSALSWSLLQVFQFNGEMIQASKTVRAKLVTLCRSFQFTLKKSGDLFRFPPVFYQKVSMTEKTRNLRFREDLKVKATYVNTRILVQSLVNCLGNGHSAWVDSLLDSVPCTKKSGTAR